jgi:hypothetical protein
VDIEHFQRVRDADDLGVLGLHAHHGLHGEADGVQDATAGDTAAQEGVAKAATTAAGAQVKAGDAAKVGGEKAAAAGGGWVSLTVAYGEALSRAPRLYAEAMALDPANEAVAARMRVNSGSSLSGVIARSGANLAMSR